jgi:mannose-6-phosphate isomerase
MMSLYPLRFEPMLQYRPWGGRRLAELVHAPLPGHDPIGESWLLSDRDDQDSVIVNGSLEGETIRRVMQDWPAQLLGARAAGLGRFPLLLKYLDVRGALSVQVHPHGEGSKTEAWVVIAAGAEARVYAGLEPHTSARTLRQALAQGSLVEHLASFTPRPGDGIFIPAGTVHSLQDVVVFEVQENSDVTLRLFDWNRIDPKTHERRPLQVEQAMACIDFSQGAVVPVVPLVEEAQPVRRERLFDDAHFKVWRVHAQSLFFVGAAAAARVLVCLQGAAHVSFSGVDHALRLGQVMLLPAQCGACPCQPEPGVSLLEIALPDRG